MKLLEDNKGLLTPPSESDKMYNPTLPTPSLTKAGNGDESNGAAGKSFPRSKSYQNETSETLELNNGDIIYLDFLEEGHSSFVLEGINKLRKQGQFCDIILVVEDHEIQAHRAVLAACSPFLFDFFSGLEETTEPLPTYKLKHVHYNGFQYLLDYMYTGRLHVPLENVPAVYATSLNLKMETATKICAGFLANHLTTANCLGIRRFTKDVAFKQAVDEYIRSNLKDIMLSKSFFGLTDLQVEVVGLDESITNEVMEQRFFSLVLDWAKENLNDLKPKLDRLVEKVNVLYLQSDNTLKDCAEVEDTVLSSEDDLVQDYKKARRRDKFKIKATSPSTNGNGQLFHKFNINPEEAVSVAEREWSIVAICKTSENAYLAIAVLDGRLMAITAHVRPVPPTNGDQSKEGSIVPDSPPAQSSNRHRLSPVLKKTSITPLQPMSSARCALGAVELDGKLVVCGGYDRGECLRSAETFTIRDNQWTKMADMNRARGRFGAAVLNGVIYVCGGSDGWKELSCVEKYDPATQKWKPVCSMLKERSNHSVVTLNDKLYCIGGCEGQRSITTCECYDPVTNTWSRIASLKTARSQACVCAAEGLLYVIGGTDLWNTLSSVECYDPQTNTWTPRASLNSARRGAGAGLVNGMMIVVGGSDGTQSLVSSEFYDFITNTWSVGPSLISPRANLSVVSVDSRLFAVGGFSGKKFLSSLEWLDQDDLEWFGHVPKLFDAPTQSKTQETIMNGGAVVDAQKEKRETSDVLPVEEKQQVYHINGSSETVPVNEQLGSS
uniref:BTB domain-containing protein n=1 Tax=Biomphalaria glabrata TaxID=6526 RepID=A0A2C9JTK3_BIOGL